MIIVSILLFIGNPTGVAAGQTPIMNRCVTYRNLNIAYFTITVMGSGLIIGGIKNSFGQAVIGFSGDSEWTGRGEQAVVIVEVVGGFPVMEKGRESEVSVIIIIKRGVDGPAHGLPGEPGTVIGISYGFTAVTDTLQSPVAQVSEIDLGKRSDDCGKPVFIKDVFNGFPGGCHGFIIKASSRETLFF